MIPRYFQTASLCAVVGATTADAQQRVDTATVVRESTFDVSGTPVAVDEGRFVVPANRNAAGSNSLTLAFVRFRSTSTRPGSPIVFLAGGPGDAASRAFRSMPVTFLNELRSIADVIAFDQRGTGMSEPRNILCPPGPMLPRDRPFDPRAALDTLRRRVSACLHDVSRNGFDAMGLTTEESADDLAALRDAIGATRLTLLAGSYGTHLALATARRHPEIVDRMALAGVEGFDHTLKLPSRVDDVLAEIARARRPSLLNDIRSLGARLAATPARFTFPTGQEIVLGEWDLQRWIAESLDAVAEIDAMLAAVPAILGGDYTALAQSALRMRLPRPINLMNLAMDCASFASPGRLAKVATESPRSLLGDAMNFPLPDICSVPGLPRLGDVYRDDSRTIDTPSLLVSGTFDGRTPVQNARDVARSLTRYQMLVIDGGSHGLFREDAVLKAILTFFRE